MDRLWWVRGSLMDAATENGGAGGGGNAFDASAFEKRLMDGVGKLIDGRLKDFKPAPAAGGNGDGGDGDGGDNGDGKKPDGKMTKLERELANMRTELDKERKSRTETEAKAKEMARVAAIKTALAKHQLADGAADDAFRFFRDEIKYNDAGELVGGADEVGIDEFVQKAVDSRAHWQPARQVGGAGATGGPVAGKHKPIDLDSIKPGMSSDTRQQLLAELRNLTGR